MPRVLILADDLSGAADCGIACMKAGLDAEVSLGHSYLPSNADIVAVDAGTRGLCAHDAARRMHHLTLLCGDDSPLVFFKKIDSTLRGHLGPELAAVLAAMRETGHNPLAVMAPAFPALGRTTVGGMHFLHGTPLHETEMGRSEMIPGQALIAPMLSDAGLRCTHIDLPAVRDGLQPAALHCDDTDVLICDAVTDEDLRAIAKLAAGFGRRAVWVGSAGLARHISEALSFDAPRHGTRTEANPPQGPALFVVGTASRRTREQAMILLSSSDIQDVVIPPRVLLDGPETAGWQAFAGKLASAISAGKDVLLRCDSESLIDAPYRGQLSSALAEMTAGLRSQIGTLFASGGETARKVLDRWGVRTLQLHRELELGVPVSSVTFGDSHRLTVITKAGDFGRPDSLLNCLNWIKKRGSLE